MRRLFLAGACVLGVSMTGGAQERRAPRPPVLDAPRVGYGGGLLVFQTVQNPTTAEFLASPDHNGMDKGAPIVSRYDMEVFTQANQTTPVLTINIGKPTPNASNIISYTQLRTALGPLPVGTYVAKMAAVGPGGTGRSAASNPFQEATRPPAAPGTPAIKP